MCTFSRQISQITVRVYISIPTLMRIFLWALVSEEHKRTKNMVLNLPVVVKTKELVRLKSASKPSGSLWFLSQNC